MQSSKIEIELRVALEASPAALGGQVLRAGVEWLGFWRVCHT
ncbi:MAG: hypothetical protein ACPGPE_10165 [Planctomycetota bacterium]